MKIRLLRCVICLGWHTPSAHHEHCPYCGAHRIGAKHYAVSQDGSKLREIFSAVHIPLALRNNYLTK